MRKPIDLLIKNIRSHKNSLMAALERGERDMDELRDLLDSVIQFQLAVDCLNEKDRKSKACPV